MIQNARAFALTQIASLEADGERIIHPISGQHIVWHKMGKGSPLVLLHGGLGCWLHWARVMPELSSNFTLWIPDMPGFGESTFTPTSAGGLDELVSALSHSINELLGSHTPIKLAGFSFGGLVAALLAAKRGHVEHMVLVGPAGHGGPRRQHTLPLPWHGLDPDLEPEPWAQLMRHNLLAQMLHSELALDALAMEIQWRGYINSRFRSKQYSRSAALAPALSRFSGEALTLWAEHDVTAVPQQMQNDFAPNGAARKMQIIEGTGHWLMYEAPAKTASLMKWGLNGC